MYTIVLEPRVSTENEINVKSVLSTSFLLLLKFHFDQILNTIFFTILYTVGLSWMSWQTSIYYEH